MKITVPINKEFFYSDFNGVQIYEMHRAIAGGTGELIVGVDNFTFILHKISKEATMAVGAFNIWAAIKKIESAVNEFWLELSAAVRPRLDNDSIVKYFFKKADYIVLDKKSPWTCTINHELTDVRYREFYFKFPRLGRPQTQEDINKMGEQIIAAVDKLLDLVFSVVSSCFYGGAEQANCDWHCIMEKELNLDDFPGCIGRSPD